MILEGVPGTEKTLLVKAVKSLVQVEFKRVQLTSDITGINILDFNDRTFTLKIE